MNNFLGFYKESKGFQNSICEILVCAKYPSGDLKPHHEFSISVLPCSTQPFTELTGQRPAILSFPNQVTSKLF